MNHHIGVGAWIRLIKAYNLVIRETRGTLARDCTLAQFDVLAHLARNGKGMTPAELSRKLLVTAGNITGLVDRMERTGFVNRIRDSRDRRRTSIQLTEKGRRVADRLIPRHAAGIEGLFNVLNLQEKKQLRSLLDKLIQKLE